MPRKIAVSTLNASTIDILNTIRANASAQYQDQVPEVATNYDVRQVGDVFFGYPNLANEFLSALVNQIALVRIRSATFNNPYRMFKKGFLETGETVEEVFVQIAKARDFSPEKAASRELKRTIPDVRSAFHLINWKVQYPVTVQREDLRQAFTSISGVEDLISRIIDSVIRAAEYDDFLLVKYLLIKAVSHGKMKPVAFDAADSKNAATTFRGTSNMLTFMKNDYNAAGVTTVTPREDQYIFMDAQYNAKFDVEVLAAAFHMEKADFLGRLVLIDDFTTFDNARFDEIRAAGNNIEEVTTAELALMADVKAILVDQEWFQLYDTLNEMSEAYVGSGLYNNYFYNRWEIVSSSPFSNAVVFVDDGATISAPANVVLNVTGYSKDAAGNKVYTLTGSDPASLQASNFQLVQTEAMTKALVAVHPYGAIILPQSAQTPSYKYDVVATMAGATYKLVNGLDDKVVLGSKLTLVK
jgi:hypothetical protein|nr:MAG TPA: Head protein [Caudoviricetes sp.]